MFAAIAALVFFLALLKVNIPNVDMVILGLLFVALHLAFAWYPWRAWTNPRNNP